MEIEKVKGGYRVRISDSRGTVQLRSRSYTHRAGAARFRKQLADDFKKAGRTVAIIG